MRLCSDLSPGVAHQIFRVLALGSVWYPILTLTILYGQWLLATWTLGSTPTPNINDPRHIPMFGWLYYITVLAVTGFMPGAVVSVLLSIGCIASEAPPSARTALELLLVAFAWSVALVLLLTDPGEVLFWALD